MMDYPFALTVTRCAPPAASADTTASASCGDSAAVVARSPAPWVCTPAHCARSRHLAPASRSSSAAVRGRAALLQGDSRPPPGACGCPDVSAAPCEPSSCHPAAARARAAAIGSVLGGGAAEIAIPGATSSSDRTEDDRSGGSPAMYVGTRSPSWVWARSSVARRAQRSRVRRCLAARACAGAVAPPLAPARRSSTRAHRGRARRDWTPPETSRGLAEPFGAQRRPQPRVPAAGRPRKRCKDGSERSECPVPGADRRKPH